MQKQQALRRPPGAHHNDKDSAYASQTQSNFTEDHAELDILDTLGLADESSHVNVKHLLLDQSADANESITLLTNHLNGRLLEGHGECLFDVGIEDNGDSMGFSKEEWDKALARLRSCASALNADVRLLMTRNTGGEEDVEGTNRKDKGVCGRFMIRKRPESVDDVIETRIAVVGNGRSASVLRLDNILMGCFSRCGEEYHAWSTG